MLKVNFKFSLFYKIVGKLEEKLDFVATKKKSALPLYQKVISTSNSIYLPSFVLVSPNAQFIPLTAGLKHKTGFNAFIKIMRLCFYEFQLSRLIMCLYYKALEKSKVVPYTVS